MIDHYTVFGSESTPLERVHKLFMYTVDDICRKDSDGCMLVNALLETPVDDEKLRKHIAKMFRVVELAIKDVLVEAAACGELAPGKDPAIQATLLVNNIHGLRVYSKRQPKGSAIKEMVEGLMATLH